MLPVLLSPKQIALREEVWDLVRSVPRQLLLDMDADRVRYPRSFLETVGGRVLGGADEVIAREEVGVLGASLACLYSLCSIVGEALAVFGTQEQKERFLRPLLAGKRTPAEALTEPRGGSDFFGTTTTATKDGEG